MNENLAIERALGEGGDNYDYYAKNNIDCRLLACQFFRIVNWCSGNVHYCNALEAEQVNKIVAIILLKSDYLRTFLLGKK